ncbi:MAG: tyrosine-type recombinase/integrase [Pseudonocardia sp.]|nr:tyrosine-type recombinase/integrase [Pseudonocardia sp.]
MDRGGIRAGHPSRTVVSGPLAPYADGFRVDLGGRGYAAHSIGGQMRLVAHLSVWLEGEGIPVARLTTEVVEDFLRVRRDAGHRAGLTGRAVAPLLGYLRGLGVLTQPERRVPETAVEVLLERFRRYLVEERGLAAASVRAYLRYAELFLTELGAPLDAAVAELSAGQVTKFLVRQSDRHSAWYAKAVVTALRSLLRFLHTAGHIPHPLVWAVPSVPGWKLTPLPRAVAPEQVVAVLGGCDRASAHGRRDYAIVLLLARLGLRAGEVSAIELGDLDWGVGELTVRGKGGRNDLLPLPVEVGEALADYVRYGRPPRCATRRLFVSVRAPFTGLANSSVFAVVARACRRAGVPPFGPHRLRHALACDLLRHGASLAEVGQVLRHSDERTTAIYAKADQDALRELARPCPAGSPR